MSKFILSKEGNMVWLKILGESNLPVKLNLPGIVHEFYQTLSINAKICCRYSENIVRLSSFPQGDCEACNRREISIGLE